MMDMVLERLHALQAELAAIDPSHELDVADRVASLASALRDALAGVDDAFDRQAVPDRRRAG